MHVLCIIEASLHWFFFHLIPVRLLAMQQFGNDGRKVGSGPGDDPDLEVEDRAKVYTMDELNGELENYCLAGEHARMSVHCSVLTTVPVIVHDWSPAEHCYVACRAVIPCPALILHVPNPRTRSNRCKAIGGTEEDRYRRGNAGDDGRCNGQPRPREEEGETGCKEKETGENSCSTTASGTCATREAGSINRKNDI